MVNLNLSSSDRDAVVKFVLNRLQKYYEDTSELRVAPVLEVESLRKIIFSRPFEKGVDYEDSVKFVIENLRKYAVHTPHPMYYGLYNPRSNMAGIIADVVTAVFNSQMAAWSHAPFAAEVERHLILEFGRRFGYKENNIDGVFGAGGAEANLTAVLCAINHAFPNYVKEGFVNAKSRPTIYCSSEAHHSILKASRSVGLGDDSVVEISVDGDQSMDVNMLENRIIEDLNAGMIPFMVVGTAGTTGSGAIDLLKDISIIAKKYNLWFHADAAYGGAAILNKDLKKHLSGIELSDSITFDAHKWLSVPMGTSLFITSDNDILYRTFRIETEYMPKEGRQLEITDPYSHSIQWSRRFIGLRLYMSLLFFGWEGYNEIIGHQNKMGVDLRKILNKYDWKVTNTSPFPVICFTDAKYEEDENFAPFISNHVIESGKAWLSVYPINDKPCLRACITNFDTQSIHLEQLVLLLNKARKDYEEQKIGR